MGYAPVLDAVSTLLSRATNFQQLENEINTLDHSLEKVSAPLGVLAHVVEQILEREREQKLTKNLKPKLEPLAKAISWASWETLYKHEEQIARLLGRVLSRRPKIVPTLPHTMQPDYEAGIESFLPDHPFLRDGNRPVNAVFEAYLFASGLLEDCGGECKLNCVNQLAI